MQVTIDFGHVLTAFGILGGAITWLFNWLLRDIKKEVKELRERDLRDLKTAHAEEIAKLKAEHDKEVARIGNDCAKDLASAAARFDERLHAAVEKWNYSLGNLDARFGEFRAEAKTRFAGAEKILGQYEVLRHGRTDDS